MRLSKNQYSDILKTIQDQGIEEKDLSLSKKKGRIRIQISNSSSFFEFFRRKSVELTIGNQWQANEHYEVSAAGQAFIVPRWEDVISRLHQWLKGSI